MGNSESDSGNLRQYRTCFSRDGRRTVDISDLLPLLNWLDRRLALVESTTQSEATVAASSPTATASPPEEQRSPNSTLTGSLQVNSNVGIGTASSQSMLQIGDGLGGGDRAWMVRGTQVAWNTDNVFFGLKNEGENRKDAVIAWGDDPNDVFRFIFAASGGGVDGQEVMRFQSNGNVGIGTTSPAAKLAINERSITRQHMQNNSLSR